MAQRVAGTAPGRLNRRFLLVAILLAGLSAALVYAKISAGDSSSGSSSTAVGDQQVVVARVPIQQRTTITASMLELKSVPLNSVAVGAFTSIPSALGKVTKYPVEANQQVVDSAVVDTSRPIADAALSLVVPTGKRAMSVQASQVANAGGLILPGDWVDIMWICCQDRSVVSKTLLRNIQVAAVAQTIVPSGPVVDQNPTAVAGATATTAKPSTNPVAASSQPAVPDASTVTLLLTPAEVQVLFLAEQNGKLRFDLRGVGDQDLPDVGNTIITQPELLPVDALSALPDALKPDGYKR